MTTAPDKTGQPADKPAKPKSARRRSRRRPFTPKSGPPGFARSGWRDGC